MECTFHRPAAISSCNAMVLAVKKPSKRFAGQLAKKIKWTGPNLDWGPTGAGLLSEPTPEDIQHFDREVKEAWDHVWAQRRSKFALLCAHYSIDQTRRNWPMELAFALANQFVTGFQLDFDHTSRKMTRKRKWNSDEYAQLLVNVEIIKKEKHITSDMEAAEVLVQRARDGRSGYEGYRGRKEYSKQKVANSLASRLVEGRAYVFPLMGAAGSPKDNPSYRRFIETLAKDWAKPVKKLPRK
jgi:hypothetical protein